MTSRLSPAFADGSVTVYHVLDPFAGSGTTLAVAARLGRRGAGVELKADYLPLIKQRCGRETARRKAA